MAWRDRLSEGLWCAMAGMGWPGRDRRLLLLSRKRLGYRSVQVPFVVLFVPHVVMIVGMLLSGPLLLASWAMGRDLEAESWLLSLGVTAFSVPFLLLIPPILGRRATVLDRRRREVREVRGLALPLLPVVPVMRRRHPLESFSEVVLRLERRSVGKRSSTEVYAVSLDRSVGPPVLVADARRFLGGRRLAERVASFAQLPLRDQTGMEHVVRRPDALDLPLANQGAAPEPEPAVPRGWQVVKDDPSTWEVQLPAPAFAHWRTLGLSVLLAAATAGMWLARPADPGPPPKPTVSEVPSSDWRPPSLWPWRARVVQRTLLAGASAIGGATGLGMLAVWVWHLATWPRGYRVTVEAGGLEVVRRGPAGRRRVRFRRQELEELRVRSHRGACGLTAISDRKVVHFADGLEENDALQLRRALVWRIRSQGVTAG